MREKETFFPNVNLGGEIAKEKGRANSAGELGNDEDIKNNKMKNNKRK